MNIDSMLSEYRECQIWFLKEFWKCMLMELCSFEADDTNCDAELYWMGGKNAVDKVCWSNDVKDISVLIGLRVEIKYK